MALQKKASELNDGRWNSFIIKVPYEDHKVL